MISRSTKNVWISNLNPLIASMGKEVILYGAGLNAANFIVICKREHLDLNILCVVDSDKSKHGKRLFDIPVVAPETLAKYDEKSLIIVTPVKHCLAITSKLNRLGFSNLLYYHGWNSLVIEEASYKTATAIKEKKRLEAELSVNAAKIDFVRESLNDERSFDVFEAKLNSFFYGQHIPLEALQEDAQYFPSGIINLSSDEIFVDCGAFDGFNILDFALRTGGKYSYVFAFEPDPLQFEYTKLRLVYEKIENCDVFNLGVYDSESELNFDLHNHGASRISAYGGISVKVISLDAFFLKKPHKPTFIKMDVEGAEPNALTGAYETIKYCKPKLAISVYHKPSHVWEIPFWIKSNFPDYKIYMRQHSNINETLCYAV